MKIKRRLSQLLFAAVAAVSLSLGYWLNQNTAGPQLPAVSNEFDATVFPEARELIPFKLQDHNGKPFTPHNLKHKWSLIFFGYTHCPDVCPTTLKVLQDFWSGLAEGLRNKTGVVFVTVDPNRDKAEELKQYISYFNPEFVGVTGNLGHITAFTRSLGILYEYVRMGKEKDSYSVNHSAQILLIDPQARLRAIFPPPHDPDEMRKNYQTIVEFYKG